MVFGVHVPCVACMSHVWRVVRQSLELQHPGMCSLHWHAACCNTNGGVGPWDSVCSADATAASVVSTRQRSSSNPATSTRFPCAGCCISLMPLLLPPQSRSFTARRSIPDAAATTTETQPGQPLCGTALQATHCQAGIRRPRHPGRHATSRTYYTPCSNCQAGCVLFLQLHLHSCAGCCVHARTLGMWHRPQHLLGGKLADFCGLSGQTLPVCNLGGSSVEQAASASAACASCKCPSADTNLHMHMRAGHSRTTPHAT